jgi:AraC-like DNA-binding protein/DNA gyrase inhibitor GyrI
MSSGANDKTGYMNHLFRYIEANISVDLDVALLSKAGCASNAKLYRDFYAYTGHSVKEYIRKRRISNACEKIKSSDIPLAVIADESGYETRQAFQKQFKNVVGMTPLEYRKSDAYYYFYPYIVNEIGISVKVGTEIIPECKTTPFYDSCLIGIEDRAIAALGKINGRIFGRNGKQVGSKLCYELMTETTGTGSAGFYATCTVKYDEQEINDGWNYLYNVWLSASMFEESGDAYFEEYIFQNGVPNKLKLYLPVKKRKLIQCITITSITDMAFVIARERGYNAERKASEKVMAYLRKFHPLLIRNARKFFVCAYDDYYECGAECGSEVALPGGGLEIARIPAGRYAVLPDDRLGDIRAGSAKMDLWLRNNGIAHENEPIFAVYETLNGKYDNESIRMKLYKRLKNDKNG